jgi:4-amino-4-deoxy-L-arabinose transferase-like glycosyltransferase
MIAAMRAPVTAVAPDSPRAGGARPTAEEQSHRFAGVLELLGVAAILVGIGLIAAYVILRGAELGYDESVYASRTRTFVTGIPTAWGIFRPPGLPIVGLGALPFGLTDASLRLLTAAFGLALLGLAWGLARRMWGALAGVLALLALAASRVFLDETVLFHNDVPSAAAVLAVAALLWWQLEERDEPGWLLLAAGPLAAAAFYLRFGSLAVLAGLALAAVLLWARHLLRHIRVVGPAVLLAIALFVPHLVQATLETGSPLGIVRAGVAVANTTTPVASLLQYARWLPDRLAGPVGIAFLVAAGLAAVVVAIGVIRTGRGRPEARRLTWLLVPACVGGAATIVVSHPEARYLLPPYVLAVIAGAGAIARALDWVAGRLPRPGPTRTRVLVGGVLVVILVLDATVGLVWVRHEIRASRTQWLAEAGRAIQADAQGPCTVVTTYRPVLGWYSRCAVAAFASDPAMVRALAASGERVYVAFTSLDASRAQREVLDRYRGMDGLVPLTTIDDGLRRVEVSRLEP